MSSLISAILPEITGNAVLKENGICQCSGPCRISHKYIHTFNNSMPACFSFCVLSIESEIIPQIHFGITCEDSDAISYEYFHFISDHRAIFPDLPIALDGLSVSIRLIVRQGHLSIFLADKLVQNCQLCCNGKFFVKVTSGECHLLTPFIENDPKVWFPSLQPPKWRTRDASMLFRRFHVRRAQNEVDMYVNYTDTPLSPIPGTNIIYFEVICDYTLFELDGQPSSIGIGFSPAIKDFVTFTPGLNDDKVAFSSDTTTVSHASSKMQTGHPPLKSGDVMGLGIDLEARKIFATINGILYETDSKFDPLPKNIYATISLQAKTDEATVNLGQRRFSYDTLQPPPGWSLYLPEVNRPFERGPSPWGHIEGYYRDLGVHNPIIETLLGKKPLCDNERYEVTFEHLAQSKCISIGIGFPECTNSRMVGMSSGCLGVLCSDGSMFDGEFPHPTIVSSDLIHEKATFSFGRHEGGYEIFISDGDSHSCQYPVPTMQKSLRSYPMVTWKNGTFHIMINLGHAPFVSETKSEGNVELFNHIKVNMTDEGLEEFGLRIDDIVESRDRVFIGKVVGMLNKRPYFVVPGLNGAVCLESPDPIYHKLLLRVVSSPSVNHKYVPVLTLDGVNLVDIGHEVIYPPLTIFSSQTGVSLLAGVDKKNRFVLRPASDLVSSSSCHYLPIDESEKMCLLTKDKFSNINQKFFTNTIFFPLDIVVSDSTIIVILGTKEGKIVGYDGNQIIEVNVPATLMFRLIGIDNGIRFGSCLCSVAAASYVNGGIYRLSNEISGVYGSHVVFNQTDKFSMQPLCLQTVLPPYVEKMYQSLCDVPVAPHTCIKLDSIDSDDLFYVCKAENKANMPTKGIITIVNDDD